MFGFVRSLHEKQIEQVQLPGRRTVGFLSLITDSDELLSASTLEVEMTLVTQQTMVLEAMENSCSLGMDMLVTFGKWCSPDGRPGLLLTNETVIYSADGEKKDKHALTPETRIVAKVGIHKSLYAWDDELDCELVLEAVRIDILD
ncbi:hypothetical protein V5O48_007535 [Marasmius crinis-equi]|uniref:Uncharacterized protein n=1 Tax=Marasmius crinis-equi TaxID=585013 RepID=A0ABR3FGD0_9AGAR